MARTATGYFTLYDVTDGTNGMNGTDAPRSTQVAVYVGPLTSAPNSPTATSIDFNSRTITGLTTSPAWQTSPVAVAVTDTDNLFYTSVLTFTESTRGGTQTVSASTPVASINFGDNIQSDNFVSGSAGWQIQRDSGNAEFSNVTVRGDSTVDTSTIGGNALFELAFASIGVTQPDLGTSWTDYVIDRRIVDRAGTLTIEEPTANFTGAPANSVHFFGAGVTTTISASFVFEVIDRSDTVLDSHTISISGTTTRMSNIGNDAGYLTFPANTFPITLSASSSATALRIRSTGTSTVSLVNSDFISFNFPPITVEVLTKPTNTAAYIASDSLSEYATLIEGGRGLSVPWRHVFSGNIGIPVGGVASSSFTSIPDRAITAFGYSYDQVTSSGTFTRIGTILSVGGGDRHRIFDRDNNVIFDIAIGGSGSFTADAANTSSGINNPAITDIYYIMSLTGV